MVRVTALMFRFVAKCNRQCPDRLSVLVRAELDHALSVLIIQSQNSFFTSLRMELDWGTRISSKPLARLCPFVDDNGVNRVGGRLRNSLLPYDSKHPVLLSKSSHLLFLICQRSHKITCHSGPRIMSALINRQFRIISLRSVIYIPWSAAASVCVRFDASNPQPVMADLPAARVQQCRAYKFVRISSESRACAKYMLPSLFKRQGRPLGSCDRVVHGSVPRGV